MNRAPDTPSAHPAGATPDLGRLRDFVISMTRLVECTQDEPTLLREGRELMAPLLADGRWLPEAFATPRADRYAQYLLHADPLERFSVVSFVWGPGHRTPVHDHTVWGLVGVLQGAERCDEFVHEGLEALPRDTGCSHVMHPGEIEAVSPTVGDWHRVSNAREDGPSISIHVYGANIGAVRRHRLDDAGRVIEFISGYDSTVVPNLWDRSKAPASPR